MVLKLRLARAGEEDETEEDGEEEHLLLDLVFNVEDVISQLGADVPLLDIRHSNDLFYVLDQANTICENPLLPALFCRSFEFFLSKLQT